MANERKGGASERKLQRNVLLLGVVSLLNDLSSEMIMPILPAFIRSLASPSEASIAIGLVGGFQESISSVLKAPAGYISDKLRRRKIFVASGYLISAIFKFFLAFSRVWQHALAFLSVERVGKGLRTAPRDAIIAESMPSERGRGFGIHRAMDTVGAILGNIVALLFILYGFELKFVILLAAVIAFSSLLPLLFVKETLQKRKLLTADTAKAAEAAEATETAKAAASADRVAEKARGRRKHSPLAHFIAVSTVFALSNFSYMFFIYGAMLYFGTNGESHAALVISIALYTLFNIFYAIFAIPFGKLSDKIGRFKVISAGFSLYALTCFCFALAVSLTDAKSVTMPLALLIFSALFASYGIVKAILEGNQRAFVADLAPEEAKATALGAFHTSVGLASLPASVIAGFLWNFSPSHTFTYGGILSSLALVLFLTMRGKF
ncbi:MAG: MFS transporter [Candidatus Methanospirare jalkutatii]|nr:MFS transporter [Candidatus Methanospirare jalkutatii]